MSQKFKMALSSCFCLLKISLRILQNNFLHPVPTFMFTEKLLSEAKARLQVPFYLSTVIRTIACPKPLAIVITKKV